MLRRPPISTRTYTPFPDPELRRSGAVGLSAPRILASAPQIRRRNAEVLGEAGGEVARRDESCRFGDVGDRENDVPGFHDQRTRRFEAAFKDVLGYRRAGCGEYA